MKYCLTEDGLGWRNPDGVILRCVNKEEAKKLLEELHSGYYGGHFAAYPQGNKLTKSTNKNLMNILKKVVGENKKSWDSKIKYAIWADRITKKHSIGKTPFEMVYGLEAKLPVNLQIPILYFAQQYATNAEAIQGRINQLIELAEMRRSAFGKMERNQGKIKNTSDH
jgi:hypothetical protein